MQPPLERPDQHGRLDGIVPFAHPPTLALVLVTGGPSARVRWLLETMRPFVDEIVVAVDRTGDPATVAACDGLADRAVGIDFEERVGPRALGWIHHHCRSDWILRLDTDEVPGTETLQALRALIADRRPSAICLQTRWVHPSPDRYIVSPQWRWEMKRRIVRNVPGLWHFLGLNHSHVEVQGELRHVDLPIYHVDLVINDFEVRRRKARTYEQERPGLAAQGFSLNDMYLPELLGDLLETAPVAVPDQELLEELIDPPAFTAPPTPVTAETVAWHDLEQYNDRSGPLLDEDYRATIDVVGPALTAPTASTRRYLVSIRNDGTARWPSGDQHPPLIRLGYRWRDAAGNVTVDGRWALSESVMPGETTLQLAWLTTPSAPGSHTLELDMIHEHVRWFDTPFALAVEVEPVDRAALRARDAGAGAAADLITLRDRAQRLEAELARERDFLATRRARIAGRLHLTLSREHGR